jgi:uncharacterized small protein (DUF1192 family)
MALPRLLPIALLTALAVAVAAPAASAHTAVFSADNKVRGSVGLLNEPTSTYAVTGLDVCFTQNTAASPRPAINVANPGDFAATLKAPSGATFTAAVEVPFGKPNCLTFEDPLVLTEPGQYLVDLSGRINGTTIDVKDIKAGGNVTARDDITFPAKVASDEELQDRIASLESKVAALQAEKSSDKKGAPAPIGALTFVLLAVLAAGRRLR